LQSGIGRLWRAPTPALAGSTEKVELVSAMRPSSEMAECYRALRTSMLLSSATSPPRTILITSALPQEGKTTTCLNTAIVLAQKGARVLVVDADLRRPGIHRTLGIRPTAGLSTVLAGQDKLESAILPSAQSPSLFVLPAGPIPPHPAELLASAAVRELLERCRKEFDHVLIDSPPMLSVTDAAILAVEVDTTILVTRFGRTTRAAMRRSRDLLAQINAPVMGVVLNGVDLNSDDSYYYYYYYYGGPNKSYYSSTPDVANERTGT
jgi:capsular exopolysaccharide synthesis family protein